jgi:hypothetical protein
MMDTSKLFRVMVLAVIFCACVGTTMTHYSKASPHDQKPIKLAPGVYDVPLILSRSLEPRREEFRQHIITAQKNLRKFAKKHGWERLTDAPLVGQVEIYDTKAGFDQRAISFSPDLQGKPIPKTFSATVEKNILFAVTPEVCDLNFPQGQEPQSYTKLITHELAHRLEVRIVNGNEDKMGPIWFFEGFAIYAADQYVSNMPELTESEIWAIVDSKDRGSYPKYKAVFIHFLKGLTLQDYVKHASEENFSKWLRAKPLVDSHAVSSLRLGEHPNESLRTTKFKRDATGPISELAC